MNGGAQQQAERVDQDVALLALDLFARIKALRVDARAPHMGVVSSSTFTLVIVGSLFWIQGSSPSSPCGRDDRITSHPVGCTAPAP